MKKHIVLLFLSLFTCSKWFAQGNLQFNKVVTYTMSGSFSASSNIYTLQTINITVPTNKVLKIESAQSRASTASDLLSNVLSSAITLNNVIIVSTETSYVIGNFPIWLNEGNYTIQLLVQNGTTAAGNGYGLISAIEFNIIP